MAYRSSPRCGFCYGRGHARNHCPEIKKKAENGSAYYQAIIDEQKKAVQNRKCSYCNRTGHNKRSCQVKSKDKIIYEQICSDYRNQTEQIIREKGFTVGSLVTVESRSHPQHGGRNKTLAMITEILSENAVPDWSWRNRILHPYGEESRYGDEKVNSFRLYGNEPNQLASGFALKLKSVSGTGLGYWGGEDSELVTVDELYIRGWENPDNSRYKLISS